MMEAVNLAVLGGVLKATTEKRSSTFREKSTPPTRTPGENCDYAYDLNEFVVIYKPVNEACSLMRPVVVMHLLLTALT